MLNKLKKQSVNVNFFDDNYQFLENVNCWHSDWKFESNEVEYYISQMIGYDFTFEYPEEIYSHNLFPYLQIELSKLDFELMSFDTQSDSYLFFLANKKDVNRILELSQIIDVKNDKL
jgi:hypothetical protein